MGNGEINTSGSPETGREVMFGEGGWTYRVLHGGVT